MSSTKARHPVAKRKAKESYERVALRRRISELRREIRIAKIGLDFALADELEIDLIATERSLRGEE